MGAAGSSTAGGGVGADTIVFSRFGSAWIGVPIGAMLAAGGLVEGGATVVAASEVESARTAKNPTVFTARNAMTTNTIDFISVDAINESNRCLCMSLSNNVNHG